LWSGWIRSGPELRVRMLELRIGYLDLENEVH